MIYYWKVLNLTIREYLSDITILKTGVAIVLSFLLAGCTSKNRSLLIRLLFGIYCTVVLMITIFGRAWFVSTSSIESLFSTYRVWISGSQSYVVYDIIHNIILFIPMGIINALQKERSLLKMIMVIFGFSLSIELLQLITGAGVFEICDLVDNTIGGLLGIAFVVVSTNKKMVLMKHID